MITVIYDSATYEVVASIPKRGEAILKKGYELMQINENDLDPIFEDDNGTVKIRKELQNEQKS